MKVPVIDQTAEGITPLSAPSVAPVQNFAPQQQQALGQAVEQAGSETFRTGQTIGDEIAAQTDNTRAKAADTALRNTVQTILRDPQGGYLNQRGQAAVDGFQATRQAIVKATRDQSESLSNPLQKLMYREATSSYLRSVDDEIAEHSFRETSQMAGEASVSRAAALSTAAGAAAASYGQVDADGKPSGSFSTNMLAAENETLEAVRIMKGAPADSPTAQAALLNLHSAVGSSVLTQMMDNRAPYTKVRATFEDMKAKGWLDLRALDTLGKMTKGYVEQESTRAAVTQNLSDAQRASQGQATSSTGTPDYQFPIPGATITTGGFNADDGGVHVTIAPNSGVQSPAVGKVSGIGADGKGNLLVRIAHPDGSATTFAGLGSLTVKEGDEVSQGEQLGTTRTPTVFWGLNGKDGQAVDPTKAGLPPVDLTKVTDEKVLGNALASLRRQITDPYLQQQATSEMESLVRHNQAMSNQQASQTYSQANDAFYKANMNWRGISPSLFNQLSPEQQQEFKDKQTQHALQQINESDAFKRQSEQGLLLDFAQHPEKLTVPYVTSLLPRLSRSTQLDLMQDAVKLQNAPEKLHKATLDVGQLNASLAANGYDNLVNPKHDDRENVDASLALRKNIKDQIDVAQQIRGKGLSREETQEIIDRTLTQTAFVPHSHFFSAPTGDEKPLYFMTPEQKASAYVNVGPEKIRLSDIPATVRTRIVRNLTKYGMPSDETSIAQQWVTLGKPTQLGGQ